MVETLHGCHHQRAWQTWCQKPIGSTCQVSFLVLHHYCLLLALCFVIVNIMNCNMSVALLPVHCDELCPCAVYILGKVTILLFMILFLSITLRRHTELEDGVSCSCWVGLLIPSLYTILLVRVELELLYLAVNFFISFFIVTLFLFFVSNSMTPGYMCSLQRHNLYFITSVTSQCRSRVLYVLISLFSVYQYMEWLQLCERTH